MRSISKRISEIRVLVDDTVIEIGRIRKIINANREECELCIREGKAYVLPDVVHIYRILAYTESSLALLKSTVDLLFWSSIIIEKNILGKRGMNMTRLKAQMISAGLNLEWLENLDNIRDDLLHQYASWLMLTFDNGGVGIKLELPNVPKTNRESKKYKKEYLDVLEINKILAGFSEFYVQAPDFLIGHIRAAIDAPVPVRNQ